MLISLISAAVSVALSASATGAAPVTSEPFTPEVFETWVDARAGTGAPVYWYSVGTVRAYPSGDLLYVMEGYDAATAHWPEGRDNSVAHQYNRKIYIFRDPDTGDVVPESEAVAYPYQFITYSLTDGGMETLVEQGSGDRIQRISGDSMSFRRLGDTHVFTAPVFLDFPIPGTDRRIEAWENYDFFIHQGAVDEPHQLSWARIGQLPAWAGGGTAVMHLITWRIEDYGDVPESLRSYVEAEAPLWMAPPTSLDEVRQLQAGQ
jgi:hypothetical protein